MFYLCHQLWGNIKTLICKKEGNMKKLITFLLMLMAITFGIINGSYAGDYNEDNGLTDEALSSGQPGQAEKPI